MRILVTGGNGSLGREMIPALLASGHEVVVLDKELGVVRVISHPQLRVVSGGVEDIDAAAEATRGVEAIIHLAWSFSDDPSHLLEHDLRGHLLLLRLAKEQGARQFIYTSTAVVYGKPDRAPIGEEDPLRVLVARKPAYGMAKEFAEKLTLLAAKETGLAATVLRFWWAFGNEIGGRHLRDMLRTAAAGKPLIVPADCGGSFLQQTDFNQTVETLLSAPTPGGRVFNLASAYVSWEEVAHMAVRATGGSATVEVVPRSSWTGAAFLADRWELDDTRIRGTLKLRPTQGSDGVRVALEQAIVHTWSRLQTADT